MTLFGFFTISTFRLDATEQVEDAFTGLRVLKFDENFITLQLRTCIPKLDGLLGQHDLVHTTEPSELIHELLIHLKDKTTEITKVEVRTRLRVFTTDLFLFEFCMNINEQSCYFLFPFVNNTKIYFSPSDASKWCIHRRHHWRCWSFQVCPLASLCFPEIWFTYKLWILLLRKLLD